MYMDRSSSVSNVRAERTGFDSRQRLEFLFSTTSRQTRATPLSIRYGTRDQTVRLFYVTSLREEGKEMLCNPNTLTTGVLR
jgi:hypothetical protein